MKLLIIFLYFASMFFGSQFTREISSSIEIHNAAQRGDVNKVKELIQNGVNVNNKNSDGWTPLITASFFGKNDVINVLIRNGANINDKSNYGYTGLHVAVQQNKEETVDFLLKHGSDINTINNDDWTPLISAVDGGLLNMTKLLIRNGASIDKQTKFGYTALHISVQKGNAELVEMLLKNQADKSIKNNDGVSPMELSETIGNKRICELFQKTVFRPAQKACQLYSQWPIDRILGGESVDSTDDFPWMAALGYIDEYYQLNFDCGGTIISDIFILTAAHCVKPRRPIVARMGKLALTNEDGVKAVNRQIKEVIAHPKHSSLTKQNDIALLKITKRIDFSNKIMPGCLNIDMRDASQSVTLIVTGWGSISAEQTIRSNELRKTYLVTMPLSECNDTMIHYNQLPNHAPFRNGISQGQYCAYDPQGVNDSCRGDSGGPLQYFDKNSSVVHIVGIVSFGISCGTSLPSIYTRVAYYLNWIEPIVWPNL
ncbi:serine protease persephone-like [Contarinia nasturtii]|uniref:serine protease persephone-like n=1 Tax=Contarinia nasturtii TaxID=265458 RepID=UPI0012D41274|nr:serine protease persephone-like [Contarinia nasturtii]